MAGSTTPSKNLPLVPNVLAAISVALLGVDTLALRLEKLSLANRSDRYWPAVPVIV